MKWKDILAAGREKIKELELARKQNKYGFQSIGKSGRHCIFFPINNEVGMKVYPHFWTNNIQASAMYAGIFASKGFAPKVYFAETIGQFTVFYVENVQTFKTEDFDSENAFEDFLHEKYHAQLRKIMRFCYDQFGFNPEFVNDFICLNFADKNGRLLYVDTNVGA